ncbi:hypothetical protein [Kocuria aegyptia]
MTRNMTGKKTSKQHRRWSEMSPGQRSVALALASIQVSLAVTAWMDLACRPAGQVNGSRAKWAAIIGVAFVGPLLYPTRGRRRRTLPPDPRPPGQDHGTAGARKDGNQRPRC